MGDPKNVLEPIKEKIGFIGGGNMAKAICEGIIQKGLSHNCLMSHKKQKEIYGITRISCIQTNIRFRSQY